MEISDESRFLQAISSLSSGLYKVLMPLSERLCKTIQEVRLRVNRPLAVVCKGVIYYITAQGGLTSTPLSDSMLIVSRADVTDTFHNICNYSVYSRQNEIVNGFVTMNGGHRAGICGTAVTSAGNITNIRDISSINIRIAREHHGCAKQLADAVGDLSSGLLICGAPCSGKTTVLRDYARILSTDGGKNVSLIDERGELAGTSSGYFQNNIGFCDVYDSYKKSEAMMQALRSMAPDIIMCDEIGEDDDIAAIEHSINSGVIVVATVHAADLCELRRKKNLVNIIKLGAFSKLVFLANKKCAGDITEILEVGEVFAD
jgi:stage III sporulation protein AA